MSIGAAPPPLSKPGEPPWAEGPEGYPAVAILEEGMREGLQIEDPAIPAADRIRLLDALSRTGLTRIVVGSFVSPKWTPQMAGIDELVAGFTPVPGIHYSALALNARGVERRRAATPPLSEPEEPPSTYAHVCDVFAQRNTNRTRAAEVAAWPATIEAALAEGATEAGIGIGAAWGSNWLGLFSHDERMDLLDAQHRAWTAAGIRVTRVKIADPMGWNQPQLVEEDLIEIARRWPEIRTFQLHLHNTRGATPASVYAALRALDGRHRLLIDSSIGGMAGCPYCGNGRAATLMPTEDLVQMLEGIGYRTGVDLPALIDVVALAEEIVGHPLYGHVSKAGPRPEGSALYAMDMPFIETLSEAQHFRLGPSVYEGAMSPWATAIESDTRRE